MMTAENDNEQPPDPNEMSHTELMAWVAEEPTETALDQFYLATNQGRRAFLQEYYNRGGTAVFEAVSHIWHSLADPKDQRCIGIGQRSGTGGTGKRALRLTLQKFLRRALSVDAPLPMRSGFPSLEMWHDAAMATFKADRVEVGRLCEMYSVILDGHAPRATGDGPQSIEGPWSPSRG